jgi:RimJ/RimL family protein N-acetyltransferase
VNFWQGTHIRLRGIEPADAEFFFAWNLDTEMARAIDRIWFPQSLEAVKKWTEEISKQEFKNDAYTWLVENRSGSQVGIINTFDCNRLAGTYKYGVGIRAEHQRQGYASDTIRLVLRYFFQELRYQKVTVHIYDFNEASIRLHERLGFVQEGRLRRMGFTGGSYFDELLFGLTVEEFQQRSL